LQRVLTTVTLLGLLVATSAAFAITEHLKLKKSPLFAIQVSAGEAPTVHRGQPVVISPVCECATSVARIGFQLRHPDHVTVTIVDSNGHTVATRIDDKLLAGNLAQHVTWDGRTDSGVKVPDGVYYPSIYLGNERHGFQLANKITVDTKPPMNVSQPTVLKPVLLAGPGRSVAIKYDFDEKGHALVYLGNRLIIVGHKSAQQAKIKWNGRLDHRPLPPGRYVLSIGARDLAGNETPAAGRKEVTVVLSYIEVTPRLISIRSGRPFDVHVETASRHYTWRLGQRHGERRRKTLRLRAPSTPGTYRLVVAQNGHTATTVVRVHK
jgi:FlgD Ig-like domain